ncbi:hypothetical protein MPTK1_4g05575 [Marchantia polymorpha subsp. ruderalis]
MESVVEKIVSLCRKGVEAGGGGKSDEINSRLLEASASKTVKLRWNGQTDENIEDLCHLLASNQRLQTLCIFQVIAFGTDTGGQLMAHLLTGNPRLKTLDLTSIKPTPGCVDALCRALEIPSATLESLSIGETDSYINGPIFQRLARMLSVNTSVKHFCVRHNFRQDDEAEHRTTSSYPDPPKPRSNDYNITGDQQMELKDWMELEQRRHMESEAEQACSSLADMLRHNSTLKSLSISVYLGEGAPEILIKALEDNPSLEELHIQNILSWGQAGLVKLIKALTPSPPNPSKLQLKVLHLDQNVGRDPLGSTILTSADLPSAEVLAQMILHNQTLETLLIAHGYSEEDWESVIVPAIAYNSTLHLVRRFQDPCSFTHPKSSWRRLLRFSCVRSCFKAATSLMGEKWLQPEDYEVLSESSNSFGMGATYSRVRGCRRLLHMAGDFQCWSKYPSAGARWMVKTSNRSYVLSFEDYST